MADENKNEAGHSNVSIQWDDTNMESIYANVATATANREEFFLLFGTHKNWRGTQPENGEVDVSLSKRIVMSPYAAKRMAAILNQSLEVYEKQFGKIGV
tara:strand:- start:4134 stop:4430 length:297 start_codon:yes stop_codon:yes gene_type:complete